MTRPEINHSSELEMFARAVESGGFSAAARRCSMTPSVISKLITRLEQRLGTRLLDRPTRQLQLTPEGCTFYERGVRILTDLEEAGRRASENAAPRRRLRVNANVPLGHHSLLPLVPEFLAQHPEVTLDIVLTDEIVDIPEQHTDAAVRAGSLKSSNLMTRKSGSMRMLIVGAPAYLARHGVSAMPQALLGYNRLDANYVRTRSGWPLRDADEELMVPSLGNARASDGEALRRLAVAGLGLARLAAFQMREDIATGRLIPVLEAYSPGDLEEVHAVYVGQGGYSSLRMRAFLDFLAERANMSQG